MIREPVVLRNKNLRLRATLFDNIPREPLNFILRSKIERVPRGIQGKKSSKDMASLRKLVSTIWAQASPKIRDGTRCPEG